MFKLKNINNTYTTITAINKLQQPWLNFKLINTHTNLLHL